MFHLNYEKTLKYSKYGLELDLYIYISESISVI